MTYDLMPAQWLQNWPYLGSLDMRLELSVKNSGHRINSWHSTAAGLAVLNRPKSIFQ